LEASAAKSPSKTQAQPPLAPKERDILVPTQNVRLVVDPKSALFVSGSVLDYSEDLQKGGFKVTNPNAVAHCSCGESFAV